VKIKRCENMGYIKWLYRGTINTIKAIREKSAEEDFKDSVFVVLAMCSWVVAVCSFVVGGWCIYFSNIYIGGFLIGGSFVATTYPIYIITEGGFF